MIKLEDSHVVAKRFDRSRRKCLDVGRRQTQRSYNIHQNLLIEPIHIASSVKWLRGPLQPPDKAINTPEKHLDEIYITVVFPTRHI